jgi:hypothetical protein
MMYSVIRGEKWYMMIVRHMGGVRFAAWPSALGKDYRGTCPVSGWTAGGVSDGKDEVIAAIDRLQGRPTHCELPRKLSEVSNG